MLIMLRIAIKAFGKLLILFLLDFKMVIFIMFMMPKIAIKSHTRKVTGRCSFGSHFGFGTNTLNMFWPISHLLSYLKRLKWGQYPCQELQ